MKLIFTDEQLNQFIEKKIAELNGRVILMELERHKTPITSENVGDRFFELGRLAGQIEGHLKFIKDFQKFIES